MRSLKINLIFPFTPLLEYLVQRPTRSSRNAIRNLIKFVVARNASSKIRIERNVLSARRITCATHRSLSLISFNFFFRCAVSLLCISWKRAYTPPTPHDAADNPNKNRIIYNVTNQWRNTYIEMIKSEKRLRIKKE